ncbi:hypothetical protein Cni_G20856 [Canna indica]|uniref:B box-type domain-containing protein n=1 Tax=Canna indica TaxID=4628 RepID=A0AAQ3KUR3_9LILI|nr:hypothetical protein Cni_G20856 [Canna indica]
MSTLCDLCGVQRCMVFCRSDAAYLCLSCDHDVHSSNGLAWRHSRTLLCDRCTTQPAMVRCIDENVSLCQTCDWNDHGTSSLAPGHQRKAINCYSGCPSVADFPRIWPSPEFPHVPESNFDQGLGLMTINENSTNNCLGLPENSFSIDIEGAGKLNDLEAVDQYSSWLGSSLSAVDPRPGTADQPIAPVASTTSKLFCPGGNDAEFCKDDFCADLDFTFENYEDLLDSPHDQSEFLFNDVRIDSFVNVNEKSSSNSNFEGQIVAEASNMGQIKSLQIACSNAVSADSAMPNLGQNADSNLYFPFRQTQSLSFSGLTGESSVGDYQDCGMSSMLLTGEPLLCPVGPESSLLPTRQDSLLRYKEKRNKRNPYGQLELRVGSVLEAPHVALEPDEPAPSQQKVKFEFAISPRVRAGVVPGAPT